MSEEALGFARSRCEEMQGIYERRVDKYGKLARASLAGSYTCYLAGVITLSSEPLSLRSVVTSSALVGSGELLRRMKKESRVSQQIAQVQIDNEIRFAQTLDQRLNGKTK